MKDRRVRTYDGTKRAGVSRLARGAGMFPFPWEYVFEEATSGVSAEEDREYVSGGRIRMRSVACGFRFTRSTTGGTRALHGGGTG